MHVRDFMIAPYANIRSLSRNLPSFNSIQSYVNIRIGTGYCQHVPTARCNLFVVVVFNVSRSASELIRTAYQRANMFEYFLDEFACTPQNVRSFLTAGSRCDPWVKIIIVRCHTLFPNSGFILANSIWRIAASVKTWYKLVQAANAWNREWILSKSQVILLALILYCNGVSHHLIDNVRFFINRVQLWQ